MVRSRRRCRLVQSARARGEGPRAAARRLASINGEMDSMPMESDNSTQQRCWLFQFNKKKKEVVDLSPFPFFSPLLFFAFIE